MFRWNGFDATQMCIGVLLLILSGMALAQAPQANNGVGIYTCIDARGRSLTSDRPIPECTDREQKVLNPSGTVKARVSATLTAQERTALEAKEKAAQEERGRLNEEKRRDRALLARYPNQAVHDKERAEALAQIGVVRQAAAHRVKELLRQRTLLNEEMEFYKKDPSKAPPAVRRQADELAQSLAIQDRFIVDQDAEIKRVNARFEEELLRLKRLWPLQSAPPAVSNPM
ncbi:MAG: DUF4124 domain-containing protein [Gammaproteobacteria bacterium]|uniref:DUF4124 domain-containing protein n=1 Tax=Rhodoferax sp. TaxID=50421 RepID=UPI0017A9BCEF|nr:DUF4124 domain-containing protein [Rhodoferax sp.]MBU3900806.1 DUF4124 domain-containing protein [Gammaproteobacteria bacterium]MBA3056649.1 DUF4124 domain-containing protein [Rhodoferax sp.]MBU3997773.1 DUF4124 domain-containing protein [Gammaproteobacteria bacterium]MBU4079557.1 DUF4124 domain-containing protein [Gammaproteobacteria bacterium]MBU4114735.1 DUF4124 domain-containing protein [Gammaproteobacteria bacterium]